MPRAMYGSSVKDQQNENLQAEALDNIEEGKLAAAAIAYLGAPVWEARENLVNHLIHMYRSGETSHDRLVGAIAELSALDRLMRNLGTVQRRGEVAAAKEFKNG